MGKLALEADENCPECGADESKDNHVCASCRGKGSVRRPRILEVDVPPGVRDGTIMRLRRDTGVNLAGIGMIQELLDRLRAVERENQRLRAQHGL